LAVVGVSCGSSSTPEASPSTATTEFRLPGKQPTPVKEVGDLVLTDYAVDPAGVPFPMKAPPGELLLVYFGYLSCPDICPLTMSDTATGLAQLTPEEAARVKVAFVTVDLPRDDGARISSYLRNFFPDGGTHALRAADDGALNQAAYQFGARWEAEPHLPGEFYGVAHTGETYVVDDTGRIVWVWPFATAGTEIAPAIESLLASTYPES
jgi:protein SCO1/2